MASNETAYQVWRRLHYGGTWSAIALGLAPNTCAYTDASGTLIADTAYDYKVRVNNGSLYAYSNTITIHTPPVVYPLAPDNLSAQANADLSIDLTWTIRASNATHNQVWRKLTYGGTWTQVGTNLSATTSSYHDADPSITPDTGYDYKIRVYNGDIFTDSAVESTHTPPVTIPIAPSNLHWTEKSWNSVRLEWTDNATNETHYQVWRRISGGTWGTIPSSPLPANSTACLDQDPALLPSTTYEYKVRAKNANLYSDSNSISVTTLTLPDPPEVPTGLKVTGTGETSVSLEWDRTIGATSYTVKRRDANGTYVPVSANLTSTVYTDEGLTPLALYYYVVSASNAGGESANSSSVWARPKPVPQPPYNLVAFARDGAVDLYWVHNTGLADGFLVKRSQSSNGPYAVVAPPVGDQSYSDTGLTNGSTYYYVVTAFNTTGESGDSNEAKAVLATEKPPAPTGLTISPGDHRIYLSWSPSQGASSYTVKRSRTSGGPYTDEIITGIGETTYEDYVPYNSRTYFYVVSASNWAGESGSSNEASGQGDSHIRQHWYGPTYTGGVQKVWPIDGSGSTEDPYEVAYEYGDPDPWYRGWGEGKAVECSGPLSAIFTWTGVEPAPSKVVIELSATAYAGAQNGTASTSNGLGDATVSGTDQGWSTSRSGTYYVPYENKVFKHYVILDVVNGQLIVPPVEPSATSSSADTSKVGTNYPAYANAWYRARVVSPITDIELPDVFSGTNCSFTVGTQNFNFGADIPSPSNEVVRVNKSTLTIVNEKGAGVAGDLRYPDPIVHDYTSQPLEQRPTTDKFDFRFASTYFVDGSTIDISYEFEDSNGKKYGPIHGKKKPLIYNKAALCATRMDIDPDLDQFYYPTIRFLLDDQHAYNYSKVTQIGINGDANDNYDSRKVIEEKTGDIHRMGHTGIPALGLEKEQRESPNQTPSLSKTLGEGTFALLFTHGWPNGLSASYGFPEFVNGPPYFTDPGQPESEADNFLTSNEIGKYVRNRAMAGTAYGIVLAYACSTLAYPFKATDPKSFAMTDAFGITSNGATIAGKAYTGFPRVVWSVGHRESEPSWSHPLYQHLYKVINYLRDSNRLDEAIKAANESCPVSDSGNPPKEMPMEIRGDKWARMTGVYMNKDKGEWSEDRRNSWYWDRR